MPYCSQCGVEVEANAQNCPLCEAPIQRIHPDPPESPRYPDTVPPPDRHIRYLVWAVSSVTLLSVGLTLLMLDLIFNRIASWSLYALTGVGVLWLFITVVVIFARRPIFIIAGQAVATAGFLVLIDLFDGRVDWFWPLALPIVAIVTGASVLVWLVARLSRRAPALIAASVLFGCGAGAVGLDLLISAFLDIPHMGWSLIVLGAATPPMIFLLYFQFRLRRKIDLARILHT